jgi:hypothetical protein
MTPDYVHGYHARESQTTARLRRRRYAVRMKKMLSLVFNRGFAVALPITVLGGLFLPALITAGAPGYDGQQAYGFPFTCYWTGGLRIDSTIDSAFYPLRLLYDVLLMAALALVVGLVYGLRKRARERREEARSLPPDGEAG